jgi:hypothetical protein
MFHIFLFVIQKDDTANAASTTASAVSFLAEFCRHSKCLLCALKLLNYTMGFMMNNMLRFLNLEVFEQALDC